MSVAVMLAIGALFTGALSDLLYKRAQSDGIDAPRLVFVQSTIFTVIIEAVALSRGDFNHVPAVAWLTLLPAGICNYAGIVLFVRSLRTGDAGVNAPVFRLAFAVSAVLAIILLGESGTVARYAGLAFAIAAILTLINTAALGKPGVRRSVFEAGLAAVIFGVGGLLAKVSANLGTQGIALTAGQALSFYLGAVLYPLLTGRMPPRRVELIWGPFIGLLQLSWAVMTFQALQTGDASITLPIAQLGFVVTAVLAVVFLRETATRAKFAGLGLAICAVVLLAIG